jgi:hypothetical protein
VLGDWSAPALKIALAAVVRHRTLPEAVLHAYDQKLGVVTCRFFNNGRWVWVTTDDMLPTDADGLIFAHTINQNEFGAALIEKCFAVLCGGYEKLFRLPLEDLLCDFAGIPAQTFDLEESKQAMQAVGVEVRTNTDDSVVESMPLDRFRARSVPLQPLQRCVEEFRG